MDLTFETIDAFRVMVGKVATDIFAKIPPKPGRHNNDFAQFPLNGRMPDYDFVENGNKLRIFCGSQWAFFTISDVYIRDIESVVFKDPVITNQKTDSIVVDSWANNGSTEETHVLTNKKASSKTIVETSATDLGVQITQSLQTKVGGTIGIANAEVQTGLEIQSHFNQHFEKSVTTHSEEEETEERTYKVPPYTKTTLTRKKGVSDYRQDVITTGILDGDIWLGSDHDFWFHAGSFQDLERMIRGGSAPDADEFIARYFQQRHFQSYQMDYSALNITVESVFKYRNIQSSEIEKTDVKLK